MQKLLLEIKYKILPVIRISYIYTQEIQSPTKLILIYFPDKVLIYISIYFVANYIFRVFI